ncbi:MAG: glycosyltransferase family 2 protein [Colwellia sp.]|nr:glycosyltransferase family 2 protein [Colwellia sp.]
MDISAIVLSFNSKQFIEKCVRDLVNSFDDCDYQGEVIVVENGSTDGCVEILKLLESEFPEVLNVIYLEKNTGTTYSRNLAMRASIGEYFVILDSDAYMNQFVLKGMIDWLRQHEEYGLVAPQLTFPDGRYQLSIDSFPTVTRKIRRFFMLKQMETTQNIDLDSVYDIDYAISACWMFHRSIYEDIGGLDEKIFYAPEDVDYCLRIWKHGKKIAYLPMYSLVHDAREVSRGFKFNKFVYLHVKGLMYYFIKHRYFFNLKSLYKRLNKTVHME